MSGQETKAEISKRLYERSVVLINDPKLRNYFESARLYYLGDLSSYRFSTYNDLMEESSKKYYSALQNNVNI